jgi:hypothetical protein
MVTDSSGEVAARFEYEPFGLVAASTGPLASGAHRFTGKPEDGAIGLYYFGASTMTPRSVGLRVGIWRSRDLTGHILQFESSCVL